MELNKRIIPCLDIAEGRTVKGVQFQGLRDAGDPVELAKKYADEGADELVFLDIKATNENRGTRVQLVERLAMELNIPFTVGGGIRSAEDVKILLDSGADKVSVNTQAVLKPQLVAEIAGKFGSQCLVVAVDSKTIDGCPWVFTHAGEKQSQWTTLDWVLFLEKEGAGEILLTSMNQDGTQAGYDLEVLASIHAQSSLPLIASGGAGTLAHFDEGLRVADAVLAASVFHFNQIKIQELKSYLRRKNHPIRWK